VAAQSRGIGLGFDVVLQNRTVSGLLARNSDYDNAHHYREFASRRRYWTRSRELYWDFRTRALAALPRRIRPRRSTHGGRPTPWSICATPRRSPKSGAGGTVVITTTTATGAPDVSPASTRRGIGSFFISHSRRSNFFMHCPGGERYWRATKAPPIGFPVSQRPLTSRAWPVVRAPRPYGLAARLQRRSVE